MILVVSHADEDHTAAVMPRLRAAAHEVRLLDLADVPARGGLTAVWGEDDRPSLRLHAPDGPIPLDRVRAVWWRRLRPLTLDAAVTGPTARAFATSETSQALNGVLDSLDATWMNPRCADDAAHHKPLQWTVARSLGLRVPRTIVTTDPDEARRFIAAMSPRRVVFKAFLASLEAWRETRLVQQEDLERLELVRLAPVIFQEYVEGVDLRVTVVGDRTFCASIDARTTTYPVDMRMVIGEARVTSEELPAGVEDRLLALLRRLGLRYGAVDLRRTDAGEHHFLEVNPAGQWLFVERLTGMPITQAVVEELCRMDRVPPSTGAA